VNSQPLNEPLSANPYASTYYQDNNHIVKMPKVRVDSTQQSYSVELQLQGNNSLKVLSPTPLK
jgi:hypothetical protein